MRRWLLLLAMWGALAAHAQISPGPLSEAHAKLEGAANCLKCHEAKQGVSPAKCLTCHTALRARIQAGKGLHARPEYRTCERCHNEHHGRAFRLIHWDPAKFDHRQTGFPLEGAHAKAKCASCHKTRSFLGLSQSCTSCHTDPHKGQLPSCTSCHAMTAWKPAPKFDHAKARFPLTGKHVNVACAKCHPTPAFRGVAFQRCTDCHKDPHAGRFGPTCTQCHSTAAWKGVQATANFDHAKTGFPLTGAHKTAQCSECHRAGKFQGTPKTCTSCHRDPHEGRLGKSCERCHSTTTFRAVANFDHTRTRFPLTGRHTAVRCAQCHTGGKLRGVPMTCNGCHTDPHKGRLGKACESCHSTAGFAKVSGFDHDATRFPLRGAHRTAKCESCHTTGRALKFSRFDRCGSCHRDVHAGQMTGDCADCHSVTRFLPSTFGVEQHQRTKFPLAGAHLAVPCNACHVKKQNVVQFRLSSAACTDCHRDPHRGETARFGTCTTCHRLEAWGRVAFDHTKTGFPLEGAHARVRCAECHKTGFKGVPRACAACHVTKER
ncbi:MAG TPA: cytochrome c family protein [Thermoanaerobaculia bacterium]